MSVKDKAKQDEAAKQEGGSSAASETQAPPTVPPVNPVVPPSNSDPGVLDFLREMQSRQDRRDAEQARRDAARDEELAAMRRENADLRNSLMNAVANRSDDRDAHAIKPQNYMVKLQGSLQQQYDLQKAKEVELGTGPKQFVIGMTGESRMTKQVGGVNRHEAEGKWREYFNVTGHDATKRITCEELPDGTPPAELNLPPAPTV